MIPRLVLALMVLGGCGTQYDVGSFTSYGREHEARMRQLSCVDIRLQPRSKASVGTEWGDSEWLAIDFEIGNRCTTPVDVDFAAVAVFAEAFDSISPMTLYDPRDEVVVATLDGRAYAREALAYQTFGVEAASIERVCVDVSGLTEGDRVAPVCFRRSAHGMMVEATE